MLYFCLLEKIGVNKFRLIESKGKNTKEVCVTTF